MTEFKYCVYCEEEPAICFDSEAEAMKYAREDTSMYKSVIVEKTEIDEDGDKLNSEVIWSASDTKPEEQEPNLVKENPFDTDFPESDIVNINEIDDPEYEAIAKQYKEDFDQPDLKEAVDALEENENEVECKVCFELFPKESCVKTDKGYVCQKCNQELHSHQGTNLDLIDKDPFDLEYDDPRLPEEKEEAEVKEEPFDATENRKHEEGIEEQLEKEITNEWDVFNHYVDNWLDCDVDSDMLKTAFERGLKGKDLPSKWYDAAWLKWDDLDYLESINGTGKDIKSKGLQAVIQDIAEAESETGDPQDIQDLKEHINDRPADIESDQELQGTDNAVVDCEVAKVIAHSEDEKPLDCKMEKSALKEPLAGEKVDVKVNEELTEEEIKALEEELASLELEEAKEENTLLNILSEDEIRKIGKDSLGIDDEETSAEEIAKNILDFCKDNKYDLEKFIITIDPEYRAKVCEITDDKIIYQVEGSGDNLKDFLAPLINLYMPGYKLELSNRQTGNEFITENLEEANNTYHRYTIFTSVDDYHEPLGEFIAKSRAEAIKLYAEENSLDADEVEDLKATQSKKPITAADIADYEKTWGRKVEALEEAKKEDELPVDPEAAKLEVHTMLNDLVADEIEAINGYEEAKKEILDTPIAHKDNILDTIDHVEDEEKEHVDELIQATTEIPFDKEEAPIEEAPVEEEPIEEPLNQDFPGVEENLEERAMAETPFDSEAKVGDKIKIIHLEGEDASYDGKEGTVEHIDGIGQLHGTWGGLAVIPGVDEFEIITEECLKEDTKAPKYKAVVSWVGTFCGEKRVYKNDRFHTYEFDHEPTKQEVEDSFYNDESIIRLKNWKVNNVRKEVKDFMDGVYDNEDGWKDIEITDYKIIKESLKEKAITNEELTEAKKVAPAPHLDIESIEEKIQDTDNHDPKRHITIIKFRDPNESTLMPKITMEYEYVRDLDSEDPDARKLNSHYKQWFEWNDAAYDYEGNLLPDIIPWNEMTPAEQKMSKAIERDFKKYGKEFGLTEAKEEGDKVKSYNDGLKLAKVHNKPVIYGYTNRTLDGKFFALDDPIVCDKEPAECEKEFRSQYKNCGQIYVVYPDKDFAESLETLQEYWWEDNDPMNQVDEDEDNVECGWCGEIYPESECRYEKDFGYLCSQCEAELKSRGEKLVFIEPAPKDECLHEDKDPNRELGQEEIDNIMNSWAKEEPVKEEPDKENPASAKDTEDKDWIEVRDAILKDKENSKPTKKVELTPEEAAKAEKETDDIMQGWN